MLPPHSNKKVIFPKGEVIDTKYFHVHQDWEVPIPGLFIVASNRKIRSIADFKKDEAQELINLLCKLRQGMLKVLKIKDVYLWQREDSTYYFHIWMFPRYKWMEKIGKNVESIRPIVDYARKNMVKNDEVIKQVKNMVQKMRKYMKN